MIDPFQRQRRYRQSVNPHDALALRKRKGSPRFRERTAIREPKKSIDLVGVLKIFASLVLLGSSLVTYVLHSRDHGDMIKSDVTSRIFFGDNILRSRHQNLDPFVDNGNFDAYSVVKEFGNRLHNEDLDSSLRLFFDIAKETRSNFTSLYSLGEDEEVVRAILQKGISTFQSNPEAVEFTAKRIQMAREQRQEFRIGFAGYSVTAGRGNYHNQSFPFVVERLLKGPMEALGIKLSIVNAGIGGVPSFPYGLCLKNFLGEDPLDAVSWDFAMNEASDVVEGIEAYIRQLVILQPFTPMLLMKDTHMAVKRSFIVRKYVEAGSIIDPIILHTDPATKEFLEMEEESRPDGFRSWRSFGAPPNAPGKSKHHPATREHDFIGWLLTMHFLCALELVALSDMDLYQLKNLPPTSSLPPPIHPKESSLSHILYGRNIDKMWNMELASCRTSFDPILGGDLRDIVISKTVDNFDIMLTKGLMFYNTAWVLDLGGAERKAKQQLARFGGLGYVDSKKAYYGVHASGSLKFFLKKNETVEKKTSSVIVCESNEKRDLDSCAIDRDIEFKVGGIRAEVESINLPGFTYWGRNICVYIFVPGEVMEITRMLKVDKNEKEATGIVLEVSVKNARIRKKEQACCISHVIWI